MILFVICLWQSRRDIAQSLVSIGILPGNLFHTKQLVTFYRVGTISKDDTHCGCQLFKDFPAESFEASWQQKSNVLKDSRMWTLSPNLSAEAYIEQGENPVNAWPLLVRDLFWVGPPFVAASLPREHARPGLDVRTKRIQKGCHLPRNYQTTDDPQAETMIQKSYAWHGWNLFVYNLLGGNLIYPETKTGIFLADFETSGKALVSR